MSDQPQSSGSDADAKNVSLVLHILPEVRTQHFIATLLSDGQYYDQDRPLYEEYDQLIRSKLFRFHDHDLRTRYHELSVVFAALDSFVPQHFFHIKEALYELEPGLKQSPAMKNQKVWQEKHKELRELVLAFQAKYNAFLRQSRQKSEPIPAIVVSEKEEEDEEAYLQKGKVRVHLPRFPRTDWVNVTVRFIDAQNLLLSDGKDQKSVNYQQLGCENRKTGKPNRAWDFLRAVAIGNGLIKISDVHQRSKIKKHKEKITDILRKIFQNQTDPFKADWHGSYESEFKIIPSDDPSEEPKTSAESKYSDAPEVFEEMTQDP